MSFCNETYDIGPDGEAVITITATKPDGSDRRPPRETAAYKKAADAFEKNKNRPRHPHGDPTLRYLGDIVDEYNEAQKEREKQASGSASERADARRQGGSSSKKREVIFYPCHYAGCNEMFRHASARTQHKYKVHGYEGRKKKADK